MIVRLIAERLRIAEEIGREKRKDGRRIVDGDRERAVMDHIRRIARRRGIREDDIEAIYAEIITATRRTEGLKIG